jgi:hypothetical protein
MTNRMLIVAIFAVAMSCMANSSDAVAKDYFLTIGGGYDVTGNQLSLEKNVLFQQSVLAAQRPDDPPREIWFADGADPHPDVQCRDSKFEENCPAARRLLAEVLGDADDMDLVYRNNEVKAAKGPAELQRVKQRFALLAKEAKAGDRVIIYVAAHGGRARRAERGRRESRGESNSYNTTLYFWNTEQLTASEFVFWLDQFPRETQVILVMVQCYAGGFAHTIFERAKAEVGLSDHARCGFFAQRHDRAAAGCTPDANEADYEEYSSYFWGALAGTARDGKTVASADYDGNGQVSFAEAHGFAMIECDTIDVPVRTTGAFLRQYSQMGKPVKKSGATAASKSNDQLAEPNFVELTGALAKLAETCRPDQAAILAQLPVKLGLGSQPTVAAVQRRLRETRDKLAASDEKLDAATRVRRNALKGVRSEIYRTWPELHAEYAPLAIELATDRADEFVRHVQKLPDYAALRDAKKREESLIQASLQLEREKARCERLIATCEEAVLAKNLSLVATPEIVARYEQLLAMEEGSLTGPATVAPRPSAGANR